MMIACFVCLTTVVGCASKDPVTTLVEEHKEEKRLKEEKRKDEEKQKKEEEREKKEEDRRKRSLEFLEEPGQHIRIFSSITGSRGLEDDINRWLETHQHCEILILDQSLSRARYSSGLDAIIVILYRVPDKK